MRTETLEENREKVLDLTEAQARALQQAGTKLASRKAWWGDEEETVEQATVISCSPHGIGSWRVVVRNAVGLISVGDLQVVVEPKIPTAHLLYLFGRSGEFPRLDSGRARAAESPHLWALVAQWYVETTERLLRGDLIRDYQHTEDDLTVIRGRVDILSAISTAYRGRLEFPCEFDEFNTDTPLNRLLKAAARAVAGNQLLEWPLRRRALALRARMEEVGELRPGDENAQIDRRTGHYRGAATLARHVLQHQGRILAHGAAPAWTFLIPTPALVEEGLRATLQEGLRDRWAVRKKGIQLAGTSLTFNPDLVFDDGMAVGDVKYKLFRGDWNRGDLYQVLAFATAYRTAYGALVGFRRPASASLGAISVGETEITELVWSADPEREPEASAEGLIEAAANWLLRTSAKSGGSIVAA